MAPSEKPGWIDWRSSLSRSILLKDLESGIIPLDISVKQAWEVYKVEDVFIREGVVYEQFEARLKDHIVQVSLVKESDRIQEAALKHDLALNPPSEFDSYGRPFWHLSAAKGLLENDVRSKLHEAMAPAALQKTRDEYDAFPLKTFREHIYQEVRRQKFIHWCEWKREQEKEKNDKKRRKAAAKARKRDNSQI